MWKNAENRVEGMTDGPNFPQYDLHRGCYGYIWLTLTHRHGNLHPREVSL